MAAASAPGKVAAPSESVQRQADSVFRWIKIQSDKPRKSVIKPDASAATKAASAASAPIVATADVARDQPAVEIAMASLPAPNLSLVGMATETSIEAASAVTPVSPTAVVEVPLKPVSQFKPDFPGDIMAKLGKGAVKLRFMVQPDGSVSAPEILSTSHRRLNSAALAAVAVWRFEPIPTPRSAQVELGFDVD